MKNLFIIHGYKANTESHWFQWLKSSMKQYGYLTEILQLPNPKHPDYKQWSLTLEDYLANKINDETIIVAHSLGVITTLDYLSRNCSQISIKGLFLISGFNEYLPNLPELDKFISQTQVSIDNINAQNIISIAAKSDPIVNIDATNRLSTTLGASTIEIAHNGHFLDSEGYTTFDVLLQQIVSIIYKNEAGM